MVFSVALQEKKEQFSYKKYKKMALATFNQKLIMLKTLLYSFWGCGIRMYLITNKNNLILTFSI